MSYIKPLHPNFVNEPCPKLRLIDRLLGRNIKLIYSGHPDVRLFFSDHPSIPVKARGKVLNYQLRIIFSRRKETRINLWAEQIVELSSVYQIYYNFYVEKGKLEKITSDNYYIPTWGINKFVWLIYNEAKSMGHEYQLNGNGGFGGKNNYRT